MNKDHLQAFITIATDKYGKPYSTSDTPQILNWCWLTDTYPSSEIYPELISGVKKRVADKQWQGEEKEIVKLFTYTHPASEISKTYPYVYQRLTQTFFSITYDKAKDKISLSRFEAGYGIGGYPKPLRIYPVRISTPLLCVSKKLYAFYRKRLSVNRKTRRSWKPRIYTGKLWTEELGPYICETLRCTVKVSKVYLPYQFMKPVGRTPDALRTEPLIALVSAVSFPNDNSNVRDLWIDRYELGDDQINFLISVAGGYRSVNNLLSVAAWRTEECIDGKEDLTRVGKESGIQVHPSWGYRLMTTSQALLDGESHIKGPVFPVTDDLPF